MDPKDDKKENPPTSDNAEIIKKLGIFGVIVSDLVGFTGGGVGLGYLAMKKLNAPWWVMAATSIAGLVLAMLQVYRAAQKELI